MNRRNFIFGLGTVVLAAPLYGKLKLARKPSERSLRQEMYPYMTTIYPSQPLCDKVGLVKVDTPVFDDGITRRVCKSNWLIFRRGEQFSTRIPLNYEEGKNSEELLEYLLIESKARYNLKFVYSVVLYNAKSGGGNGICGYDGEGCYGFIRGCKEKIL